MRSKSDFWLSLHNLAHDYELDGDDEDARICSLGERISLASRCALIKPSEALLNTLTLKELSVEYTRGSGEYPTDRATMIQRLLTEPPPLTNIISYWAEKILLRADQQT